MRAILVPVFFAAATAVFLPSSPPAAAKGCVKGAIIGGVAGHYVAHHGLLGAGAGCVIGHHEADKRARERAYREGYGSSAPSNDREYAPR